VGESVGVGAGAGAGVGVDMGVGVCVGVGVVGVLQRVAELESSTEGEEQLQQLRDAVANVEEQLAASAQVYTMNENTLSCVYEEEENTTTCRKGPV